MNGVKKRKMSTNMTLMVQLLLWKKQFFPHLYQTQKGERRRASQQKKAAAKDVGSEKKNKPEPKLDSEGRPLGVRMCKSCKKIAGHNSRTCKQRLEKIKPKNAA